MKNILLTTLLLTSSLFADGAFSAGNKHMGFQLGTQTNFNNTYTVLGVNVNYFVIDNLSIGASYQAFLGSDPQINDITVPVTYYIPMENTAYRPYLGAFYNQRFMDNSAFEDYSILGGRLGISMATSLNSFVSLGWVQEFSNSNKNIETKGYPEVTAGFAF